MVPTTEMTSSKPEAAKAEIAVMSRSYCLLLCGTYVSHYLMVQETKTEKILDSP